MVEYFPYDVNSTQTVTETATIANNRIQLRYVPKKGSITIAGYSESSTAAPAIGRFFCDYANGTAYRESNRLLIFNATNNGETVTVNYIAVATPVTAADMNEIREHLENAAIHGSSYELPTASAKTLGGVKIGDGLAINSNGVLSANATEYTLPTASATTKGGVKIGSGLSMSDESINVAIISNTTTLEDRTFILEGSWSYSSDGKTPVTLSNDPFPITARTTPQWRMLPA